jgi:hypothetical protein
MIVGVMVDFGYMSCRFLPIKENGPLSKVCQTPIEPDMCYHATVIIKCGLPYRVVIVPEAALYTFASVTGALCLLGLCFGRMDLMCEDEVVGVKYIHGVPLKPVYA